MTQFYKFTRECSTKEVNFLDTTVSFDKDNKLITTLYNKPTDTHLYLHYTSAHPHNVMEKSPYGQFLRLRRICSLEEDYKKNSDKLIDYYVKRGYPRKNLESHQTRAGQYSQSELLKPKEKTSTDKPVMVTTYNPVNPNIRSFIHKNWHIIENTEELYNVFPDKPLVGFRRLPNLRSLLTSNTVQYPPAKKLELTELPPVCTRPGKCTYCPLINKKREFTSHHTGKVHKAVNLPDKHRISCEIYNVVYLIECSQCQRQYCGESSCPLRKRIYEPVLKIAQN